MRDIIPIPESSDYVRLLLIGTTGAGKTTLVRQLLGTDPERERFPSTSASRTTVFDTEIITADGDYSAVVTFMAEEQVRQLVEDCVLASISAYVRKENFIAKLLEHTEQRFRLSYILGTPAKQSSSSQLVFDDEEPDTEDFQVDNDLAAELQAELKAITDTIENIALSLNANVQESVGVMWQDASDEEAAAFIDALEKLAYDSEHVRNVTREILAEVRKRFDRVSVGEFDRTGEWPNVWTFSTPDRKAFLSALGTFTSNYAPRFGQLLTPIVSGLRARGPFRPAWMDRDVNLVIFDREGLGHTPDSAVSVPTHITEAYELVDAVIIVDSAASPMQAAPSSALRSVVTGGYESRVFLAFTHFDDVRGDNFAPGDFTARELHVRNSLDNVVNAIGNALGEIAEESLKRSLDGRVFYFSNLHKKISNPHHYTLAQLKRFSRSLVTCRTSEAAYQSRPRPIYQECELSGLITEAANELHELWDGRLGIAPTQTAAKEHWTRIKALCRRLGFPIGSSYQFEYDNLRPVADFIRVLSERLARFVGTPMRWEPSRSSNDAQRDVVAEVSRTIFKKLHEVGKRRLAVTKTGEWSHAYDLHGVGSTKIRAGEIKCIFTEGAPAPLRAPANEVQVFMDEVREIVVQAVHDANGRLLQTQPAHTGV